MCVVGGGGGGGGVDGCIDPDCLTGSPRRRGRIRTTTGRLVRCVKAGPSTCTGIIGPIGSVARGTGPSLFAGPKSTYPDGVTAGVFFGGCLCPCLLARDRQLVGVRDVLNGDV